MRKSRFSEEQITKILAESRAGANTSELCRKYGVSTHTFYKWRESLRKKLGELQQKEGKLLDILLEGTGGNAHQWLDGQLKKLKEECESLEKNIQGLEREKSFVEQHLPNPKNMQKMLEHVFQNFADAEALRAPEFPPADFRPYRGYGRQPGEALLAFSGNKKPASNTGPWLRRKRVRL